MTERQTISGKIDDLLEEKEGEIIATAVARAVKVYQSDPSAANFRDMQSAKKAYKEFKGNNMGLTFDGKSAVHRYLVNMGYKMGKSKLNSKLSKDLDGMPRTDGVWTKEQIDKYAAREFTRMNGTGVVDQLQEEIKREELRLTTANANTKELEYSKKKHLVIDRSKVNRELVTRMIQLRKDEKTDNKVKAAEVISLIAGEALKKAPLVLTGDDVNLELLKELLEEIAMMVEKEKALIKLLNKLTDKRLNKYAKPFDITVAMTELEKEMARIEAEED